MNKWKFNLQRWSPRRGKKDGKKCPPQTSFSLEPPSSSHMTDDLSALRTSISLEPGVNGSSNDVLEDILSQKQDDSSTVVCEDLNKLRIFGSPEEPSALDSAAISAESDGSPRLQCDGQSSPCQPLGVVEGRDPTSVNLSTTDASDYLPMLPRGSSRASDHAISLAFSIQPPAIPSSSDKSRRATHGYIPLDTCSSGKRLATFTLEEEERFKFSPIDLHPQPINRFPNDLVESQRRPSLPTKHSYFLESVPPIPSYNHTFHEKLPPPLPTKVNIGTTAPAQSRRKVLNCHSVGYTNQVHSGSWNPSYDRQDAIQRPHKSFHCFSEQWRRPKPIDGNFLSEYVECDNNNNNSIECTHSDISDVLKFEEKGYYNDAVDSLPRFRYRHVSGRSTNGSSSARFDGIDRECRDLLRRPVPLPNHGASRFHSYASNSFKKKILEDDQNGGFEHEALHRYPRRIENSSTSVGSRKHFYGEDTDSLDGSSGHSNEDTNPSSEYALTDDPCNMAQTRFAVSRNFRDLKVPPSLEINYLELNLDQASETVAINKTEPERVSNYRDIDWLKTKALRKTMKQRIKVKGIGSTIIST